LNTDILASEIAMRVTADTSFWISVVGLFGVLLGAIITVFGNFLLHWFQHREQKIIDKKRKILLITMLSDLRFTNNWRNISTLSRVVGADEETTKKLLIEIGARGSELDDKLWGLIKYHPLDKIVE
jgi:hypothetical protein